MNPTIDKKIAERSPKEDDIASIIYTSGTTGTPKGVMLTNKNLVWNAVTCSTPFIRIHKGWRALSILPLSHVYEFTIGLLLLLINGCTITYLGKAPSTNTLMPALKGVRPHIVLSVPLLIEKVYRRALAPKFKEGTTLSKLAVSKCIKDNQLKEEIRLFYVALTRAKQLMYVTATVSESKSSGFGVTAKLGGAGCDLDFISSAVFDGTVKCMPFRHYADEDDVQKAQPDTFQLVPDEDIVNAALSAQAFEYPYKQATSLAMKYSVSALDSKDDDAIEVFEEAAKRGTAYHKVMQYIDYSARGAEEVERQMDELVNRNILTKEERESVSPQDIAKCLESDIMKVALEAEKKGKCHREQSFMMYKKASEVSDDFTSDDRVLVQGVIDLFIDGEKKIIVDFKTSSLKDEKTLEKYKKQLYLYKSAVESAINAKVDEIALYSFATGKTVKL